MDEALKQAFINNPLGVLSGIALIMFVFYLGLTLLFHGWPRSRK